MHEMQCTRANPLSARECEVVQLIAAGLSNRQIGARLAISDRTAESHVRHILIKLELRTRAQVAVWGVHRGLISSAPA